MKYYKRISSYGQGSEIISKQENMKLETTKEKVLAAASKCRSAKQALSELFPEAFEEDGVFVDGDLRKLADVVDKIYFNHWLKIPGDCSKDKAESISKLIYNTWIKNAHV